MEILHLFIGMKNATVFGVSPPRRFCMLFFEVLPFTDDARVVNDNNLVVVNTVHWDEPIRLQDFSTNQIQGLRSRSQRF